MVLSNLVYLRILAIFLIVNSHLDNLYPLSRLAFGGHLGNSIFYFISGMGLAVSYNRNPVSAFNWGKRRAIKLIIPLLIYIGIINIGNFEGLTNTIFNNLIWHDIGQLESFIPVLLGLYILFFPLNKLSVSRTRKLLIILMFFTLILFLFKIKSLNIIPHGLPSRGIFFTLNALICFMLGIYSWKIFDKALFISNKNKLFVITASVLIIIFSQGAHQYISSIDKKYIYINFYLNFLSVIALYQLIISANSINIYGVNSFLQEIALSSLAVYIVHFKIIEIIKITKLEFPYNIICVYLYSFIFAYSISKLSNGISNYALTKFSANADKQNVIAA